MFSQCASNCIQICENPHACMHTHTYTHEISGTITFQSAG